MNRQYFLIIVKKTIATLSTALAKLTVYCKYGLQQGILQAIVYALIGIICFTATQIAFDYVYKYNILQNSIIALILSIIGIAVICSVVMIVLLQASLRINLALKVTLPKAVEFSSSMRKIGLLDFDTQLAFISTHKMRIFIASKPMLHDIQENVRARRYMFLAHKDVLSSHKGKGTLCLDAEEYESIVQTIPTPFSAFESTTVAEKDAKIAALQSELLHKTTEIGSFAAENAALKQECADWKSSAATAPGRSEKNDKFHASRAPFWLVAVPLIQRLRQEAKTDTVYSKDKIQTEFERELENYPAFKAAIKDLLSTDEKIRENTPFELKGWGLRAICDVLREYGVNIKSAPGPEPKK
jgi:hypothetical protein